MLTAVKKNLAKKLTPLLDLPEDEIFSLFEKPKKLEHGHLAMPVFFLAKKLKKAPPMIAKDLAEQINTWQEDWLEKAEPVSGYLNFHFEDEFTQKLLLTEVHENLDQLGYSDIGKGQKIGVEFSSPNVAKPMHIGHLRATMIGQAIYNLAKTQGFEVEGVNHLGDWGVQFGKLAWAYQKWGSEYDFESKAFDSIYALYVRFHEEAEKDPELDKLGSLEFKKLEEGDAEIKKLWERFVDISMQDYQRLFDLLGVKHDVIKGESFYSDRLKKVEADIEAKGLLEESEGAMVVRLDEEKMPPCLVRKSDGASLYATRDLAAAIHRMTECDYKMNIYVVGGDQTLHFRQIFKVLDKMGYDWAKDCHHIAFGMYRFKDAGRISSRKGGAIFLEDVLRRGIDSVEKIISEKNPDLPDQKTVAKQVGIGAIVFNDLVNDRVKDVEFDWDKALDFNGDSGPYVQYTAVRCRSILRKYEKEIPKTFSQVLATDEERKLIKLLLSYGDILQVAFRTFKPNLLASYLLDVCRAYSHFYHACKVLGVEESLESSRVALVFATQKVLETGLGVLNIETPEAM